MSLLYTPHRGGRFPHFSDFYQDNWSYSESEIRNSGPAMQMYCDDTRTLMEIAVPGFLKSELNVSVENRILSISGKVEDASASGRRMHFCKPFEFQWTLSDKYNADEIDSSAANGILYVVIPFIAEEKRLPLKKSIVVR